MIFTLILLNGLLLQFVTAGDNLGKQMIIGKVLLLYNIVFFWSLNGYEWTVTENNWWLWMKVDILFCFIKIPSVVVFLTLFIQTCFPLGYFVVCIVKILSNFLYFCEFKNHWTTIELGLIKVPVFLMFWVVWEDRKFWNQSIDTCWTLL